MHKGSSLDFLRSGGLISLDRERVAVGWGEQCWQASPSPNAPSFFFPDYFLAQDKPWLVFENFEVMEIASVLPNLPEVSSAKLNWKSADKEAFFQQCEDLNERIRSGELQKGVPYAFETSGGFTPAHCHSCLYSCLKMTTHFPLSLYGFWNEHEGMIGATPERLFRQSQNGANWKVETCAIAGTIKGAEPWKDNAKLKEEHEIVVRGIIESLSPYGKVSTAATSLIPFSQLSHLATPIELAQRFAIPFDALVKALHPTAALGAYPKEPGKIWLNRMQSRSDRRRYGAPAGLKMGGSEEGHCLVAIRNVQWRKGQAMLGAGCGFVAESGAEQEWDELQMKLRAMKEILQL